MRTRFASTCLVLALVLAGCEPWPWREQRGFPATEAPSESVPSAEPGAPSEGAPIALAPKQVEPAPRGPVIQRGTGSFVNAPAARSKATIAKNAAGEVTLNVVDAELREVVRLVLEDALGANYLVDPTVGGTITVQTSEPVPVADLVPMLDAVLRVNGAALVRAGNLYKVVPIDQALSSGAAPDIVPVADAGNAGFAVQVVPVRFVSALELAAVLEPFAPPGGSIQVDADRNLLVLAGSAGQLSTLTDLASMFDVDWLAGMSFGLFRLQSAPSADVIAELEQIFDLQEGPLAGIVRVLPVERLNAVLVMSKQPQYLDQAEAWIERLDIAAEGEESRIFVYSVQNGRAADLAEVLGQIFEAESAAVGASGLLAPGQEAVQIRSSGFETGDANLDQGAEGAEPPAPATRGARGGVQTFGAAAPTGDTGHKPIRIIADETTNSLVIRATPRDYRKIQDALEDLDIIPLQVLIEATIAEVLLNDALKYGVEWFFRFGDFRITQSRLTSGLVTPNFPGFAAVFSNSDVRVAISALEQVSDVNVVSSPQVLVLDNQTAQLQVGDQVPIATQSSRDITNPDAPVVNTIEQRDTGVILSVTPRVNASGLVLMEIEEETSDPTTTTTSEIDSPTIRQRRISSTVAVKSGETVVLGGLIRDDIQKQRSGVPFLSGLPIIGPLFGTRDNKATRNELLVLITPRVVRNPSEARDVTNELRRRLRGLMPLEAKVR